MRGRPDEKGVNSQRFELRKDDNTNTITSVQKDNLVVEDICGTANECDADSVTYRIRRLTPKECWRLMGFEDDDFEIARNTLNQNLYKGKDKSSSQLYKMAGNSIVVDVLLHIFSELYDAMPYLFDDMHVGSFFSGIGAFEKALSRLTDTKPDPEVLPCGEDLELTQLGYINGYNGDANRIYDAGIARTLKAEAGGGGAKTGWYRVKQNDATMGDC